MSDRELAFTTIEDLLGLYRRREVSPVEVVTQTFARIDEFDSEVNAYIRVLRDEALAAAKEAEAAYRSGDGTPPLAGVPVAVKDNFDLKGTPTTCASPILKDKIVDEDATAVRRLREAGAIVLGKTTLLEFAYGGVHEEFGNSFNPWNLGHTAGGSSSGSAAAVAAGLAHGTLGTDTSGSIRGPAAFCGVVGHKPTYGLVSRSGVVPLSWSLDYAGPMARRVGDAARLLDVTAGYDPLDPTSIGGAFAPAVPELDRGVEGLRLGLLAKETQSGVDPEVREAVERAAKVLQGLGADVELVDADGFFESVAQLMVILMAEAAAYHEEWLRTMPEKYTDEVRHRLQLGMLVSGVDYIYAQRLRRQFTEQMHSIMESYDALILPTVPDVAPPIAGYDELLGADPGEAAGDEASLAPFFWRFAIFNLTGQPAVSLPCGFNKAGLPIGLQIAGKPGEDARVLRIAQAYETATDWHKKRPSIR